MTVRPIRLEDAEPLMDLHVRAWRNAYAAIMPNGALEGLLAQWSIETRIERLRERLEKPDTECMQVRLRRDL